MLLKKRVKQYRLFIIFFADIDRQLYAKYHLTSDEITFIEKMIKPME